MKGALMILGTHSNAGKSLLATAFCRILARRGLSVAPFKAQNMSNNAGVTPEGGEMGRAQLTQAEAAGIAPHTDMNPVLLKPETGPDGRSRSQVILDGRPAGYLAGDNWFRRKAELWDSVAAAYDRLARRFDVVILEGAGSPAEINLKAGDIVNLRMARHAKAACLLVGDIDRGGVFAALAGTVLLLDEAERQQIQGFVINKFRGDARLLGNATELLAQHAFQIPTLGIIPYLPGLEIPDEDAVALEQRPHRFARGAAEAHISDTGRPQSSGGAWNGVQIGVVRLPHIANFDEFSVFDAEPSVQLHYLDSPQPGIALDALIVPGTKSTLADLGWLRRTGMDRFILHAAQAGMPVVGICGGYQLLGRTLHDPFGLEGGPQTPVEGLDLLPIATEFSPAKTTHQVKVRLAQGEVVRGYEIHTGQTTLFPGATPLGVLVERSGLQVVDAPEGAVAAEGRIWGTYLHGIFENDAFRRRWLAALSGRRGLNDTGLHPGLETGLESLPPAASLAERRRASYDRLADAVEEAIGWPTIWRLIEEGRP